VVREMIFLTLYDSLRGLNISVGSSRANLKIANNLEGFFIVLPFTKYNPKGQGTFFLFCLEN
jgi:hypothetical protein